MASIIQIKRSGAVATPSSLALGELAYSYYDSIAGGTLYVGVGPAIDSLAVPQIASRVAAVGGEKFMTLMQAAGNPGVAIGDKFLLLDSERAIDFLYTHELKADSAFISQLNVDSAYISRLTGDSAFMWKLDVDSAYISRLTGDSAHIIKLDVDSGYISRLMADSAYISQLDVDSAYISRLMVDSAYISQLDVDSAFISRLKGDSAYISQLDVDSAFISRLKGDSAYISQLDVDSAFISRLKGDSAYISQLDVDSAYISRISADSGYISQFDADSAKITNAYISQLDVDSGHSLYHSFGIAYSPEYRGPATINIDPFPFGDVAGDVNILGNLNVQGTTTSIQSETVTIVDKNIVVADNAADSAFASGAGITVGGPVGASFTWRAGAAGTQYENYWTTNRLFYNKDLQADSAYFKYFRADSADVDFLRVNRLEFNAPGTTLAPGTVPFVNTDKTLGGDSDFMYDSDNGLKIGHTQGNFQGLTIKPTGEIVSYSPAMFQKLRVTDLLPGSVLTSGNLDSIQGGELFYGEKTDRANGTRFGLMVAEQIIQDSGWFRFVVDKNTGVVDAAGVRLGSFKSKPELLTIDPNSIYYPNDSQAREFYGLTVTTDGDSTEFAGRKYSLTSTLPINYFKSDLHKDSGRDLRRFPGDGTSANDSDVSVLIRAISLEDSSLFEVHKDGSINFTGELLQNGVPFTGGGLFTATATDDAYFAPRDFSATYPYGGFGRIAVGTDKPKSRFEVHGGPFQVKGPLAGSSQTFDASYNDKISGEISMANDLVINYGDPTLSALADSDKGSRFSFVPGKASTRGGYFTNHNDFAWGALGQFSAAFGRNVKASGQGSFATGDSSQAGGIGSIAMGFKNKITGLYSVGIGASNSDGGDRNILLGAENVAKGDDTFILGTNNVVSNSGKQQVFIGLNNKSAGGNFNFLIGQNNTAQSNAGYAFGVEDSVGGALAFAIGSYNKVGGGDAFAFGRENIVSGQSSYAFGMNGHIANTANKSINFQMVTTTPIYGAGADLIGNPNRTIPGVVVDDNLMAIQGGNVSIGRESDMFDAIDGAGNLFVGGNIIYGGNIFQNNPEGGTPIAGNPFVDDGRFILTAAARNIGVQKTDPNTEFDVRGDFQVDGLKTLTYSATDSAIFDSAGVFPGNEYNNMFMYSSRAGLIRAGEILLAEHQNSDLGITSIGMGEEPYARGFSSISLGSKNKVGQRRSKGDILFRGSTYGLTSQGKYSVAIGKDNQIITDKNMFLGEGNVQDSTSTGTNLYAFGIDNKFGAAPIGATNKSFVIGNGNRLDNAGDNNYIIGKDNKLDGTSVEDNLVFGKDNSLLNNTNKNNIVIGTGWKDSHTSNAGVNHQYGGSVIGGTADKTIFIGGNTFIPTGLTNGIVIMKPEIFNDSGTNILDSAYVNRGLNNTNIMIGKTARTPHNNPAKYVAGFNPNYTLDVHGDVNIDSGATLYIGGVNIKSFIAGTEPVVVISTTAFTTPVSSFTESFTINPTAASVTATNNYSGYHGTGGHKLAAGGAMATAGGAGSGLAIKFIDIDADNIGTASSFNYNATDDNVYFVEAVDENIFNLFTDRACTVALDMSAEPGIFVPDGTGTPPKPIGTYEVVTVAAVATGFTIDNSVVGGNLKVKDPSSPHGLKIGDGVRFQGVVISSPSGIIDAITFFAGPDDGAGNAGTTNEFEIFHDQALTQPVTQIDFGGTIDTTTTPAIYARVVPTVATTPSADLNVLGKLTVHDSATVEGSIHFRQSVSGSTFTIGDNPGTGERMSFDSFVVRPTGGLIPILEQHLDSAYVQARVSIDNFWALKEGDQLINYQPYTGTITQLSEPDIPQGNAVTIARNDVSVGNIAYKDIVDGIDYKKFSLDVLGKARIDLPNYKDGAGVLLGNRPTEDNASLTAAASHRSPIITTSAQGSQVAWPTEDYIATIVTNDFVKQRMNIDSAVIASVIDSGYLKTVISPNYILHNANDSSHWRRSADGHTLYFGGVGFNAGTQVAIGADSAPIDHPGSRLYVKGDVRVDSGFSAGGHSLIEGSIITPDDTFEFIFTDNQNPRIDHADSYVVSRGHKTISNTDGTLASFLAIASGADTHLPLGDSSITIVGIPGPALDDSHIVVSFRPGNWNPPGSSPRFDSSELSIGTGSAALGVQTGDFVVTGTNTIELRLQSLPQWGTGTPRLNTSSITDIRIDNRGLHPITSLKGSNLVGLKLKDSDINGKVLSYVKNGLTRVYINDVLLDSDGERWEEKTNSLIHVFDSAANTRLKLDDKITIEARSEKNDASLTVRGPLTVASGFQLENPPITLSGNLNITSSKSATGEDSGSAQTNTQFTFNDSAIFKTGFTVDGKIAKIQNGGLLFGANRRADSDYRAVHGGLLWDSVNQTMTTGESAELYFGPYYPSSYDSAKGFILTNPYIGRSFDSNLMRVIDSTYIGERLITPWNRIGPAGGNQRIYYDEEGAVIVGKANTLHANDPTTRFAVDSGNVLFLSSNIITIAQHPKAGVIPLSSAGTQIGAGSRLMWIPEYGAFRAGEVDGTNVTWDSNEVGYQSQGIGYNTLATDYSTAIGYDANAGNVSYVGIAKGPLHTTASVSVGHTVTNPGQFSVALGKDITNSNKQKSVSIGLDITNKGQTGTGITLDGGIAIGKDLETGVGVVIGKEITGDPGNHNDCFNNTAIGNKLTNTARNSVVIGYNLASAQNGLNIGRDNTTGVQQNSVIIGKNSQAGTNAVAIGSTATAGQSGTSIGQNTSTGQNGVSIGFNVTSGQNGIGIGLSSSATGQGGISIGRNQTISGKNAVAFGTGNSSGEGSYIYGKNNSPSRTSFVAGRSNIVGIDQSFVIGDQNKSISKSSRVYGSENKGINSVHNIYGHKNENIKVASNVYGNDNKNFYNVNIYGNANTGLGIGGGNSSQGGFIFGASNILNKNGNIYGSGNTITEGGDAYGRANTITDFGYAFGHSNTVDDEGFAYGHGNIIDGTTTKAYGFGEGNQATLGGVGIGITTVAANGGITLGTDVHATGVGSIAIGRKIQATGEGSIGIGLDTTTEVVSANNTLSIMGGAVAIGKVAAGATFGLDVQDRANFTNYLNVGPQSKPLYNYIQDDVANQAWIRANANATYVRSHIDTAHYRASMPASQYFYNTAGSGYLHTTAPRVGINTATPGYNLDVNGSLNVQSLYWQGDRILDSNQGNQVYLTHQVAQFFINADSATHFFDSDYIFARQQNYGFNQFETYQGVINANYINALVDADRFLDSAEAIALIASETTNYAFQKNVSQKASEPSNLFRMGVRTNYDPAYTMNIKGIVNIVDGDLQVDGDIKIKQPSGSFVKLETESPLVQTFGGTVYLPAATGSRSGIGIDHNSPGSLYAINVGTDIVGGGLKDGINVAAGMSYYIDGQDIFTSVLDSNFVNTRVQKEDLTAAGKLDSAHFKFIIDSDYITSIADSDYVKSIADSDYVKSIADSDYIKFVADSDYVKSIADSDYIKFVADSDYIKLIADSDYIKGIADSDYVKSIADSDYIKGIADSDYVKSIADSDYIKGIADSDWVKSIADSDYVKSIADSDYIKFVADSDYVKGIVDSAHVDLITGIGSRSVDFGPHQISFKSVGAGAGSLPNPVTYPGMTAVTTSDNKARIAKGGSWTPIPLENTNVTFNTILPGGDKLYDLGSPTAAWKDLYISGSTIHLGGLRLKDSGGVFLTTDSLGVATALDLSGANTSQLAEGTNLYYTDARFDSALSGANTSQLAEGTNLYYTDARFDSALTANLVGKQYYTDGKVDSNVTGKDLDMGTNKILYSNVYAALGDLPSASSYHGMFAHVHGTGKAYFAHAGSWIDLASGADITTAINNLIDGAPAAMDTLNEFAAALGNDENFATTITALIGSKLDSDKAITLIDSAYVQARVVPQGIDSSAVIGMVDSAYVQARSLLIDSAYVQARVSFASIDSDYVQARVSFASIDSDYVQARQTISTFDSAEVLQLIDSDYILARSSAGVTTLGALADVDVPSPTNGQALVYDTATSKWIAGAASGGGSADSATIISLIDSDYILARVTASGGEVVSSEYSNFRFTATANQTTYSGADVAGNTLAVTATGIQVYLNGIHLLKDIDYTVSGTTAVVLTTGANVGDDLVITNISTGAKANYIVAGEANFKDYKFRATAGQTAFTGNDLNSQSLSITDSNHQVFINGIRLNRVEDYNVNASTNTVTLTLAAADSDDVIIQTLTTSQTGNVLGAAVSSSVDSAVAALVDAAPATLNTLNELAAALGDDENYAATTATALGTKLDNTSSITSLADVHTTAPTEGQILIWDNSNSYWAPGVLPAGTDSAAVTGMIDSAYIEARASGGTFTNAVNFANYYYIADSGQTVFSGNDANGAALAIDTANYQVFNNGIRLVSGVDYTVNAAANSITLNGFTADSGDDLVINTLSQTVTTSHIVVGDTFMNTFKFIATSGQTSFTGTDANSKTLGIDSSNFNVFQNGIKLMDSDDFTSNPITNTITLTSGASTSDEIVITAIENKASNVTVDAQALFNLVDSAYIAARTPASTAPDAWIEVTTTPLTLTGGQRLIVDTSTAKTVNLPATAMLGDEVKIIDGTGQAATNAITIGRNGHKIEGEDSDLTIDVNRAAFGLVYYNVANGWLFTEK